MRLCQFRADRIAKNRVSWCIMVRFGASNRVSGSKTRDESNRKISLLRSAPTSSFCLHPFPPPNVLHAPNRCEIGCKTLHPERAEPVTPMPGRHGQCRAGRRAPGAAICRAVAVLSTDRAMRRGRRQLGRSAVVQPTVAQWRGRLTSRDDTLYPRRGKLGPPRICLAKSLLFRKPGTFPHSYAD